MKSKKAEIYLNRVYKGSRKIKAYDRDVVDKALEIAEEEMKEKATEAHLYSCSNLYDRNCYISESGMCEYRSGGECEYMKEFINELNKQFGYE